MHQHSSPDAYVEHVIVRQVADMITLFAVVCYEQECGYGFPAVRLLFVLTDCHRSQLLGYTGASCSPESCPDASQQPFDVYSAIA